MLLIILKMENNLHHIKIQKSFPSSFFIFLFLWILFSFNTYNADSDNYRNFYELTKYAKFIYGLEPGFTFFMRFCHKFSFSYTQFCCLYSFIGFCFLWDYIRRYTKHTSIVLFLYALFPFFFQAVQIRFFMSSMISLWSLHYLIDGKRCGGIKFFCTIIVACTFHISSLFYLILCFTCLPMKKMIRYECLIMIISFLMIFVLRTLKINKLSYYLNSRTRFATKIFFVIFFITIIYLVYIIIKYKKTGINKFEVFSCKALISTIVYFVFIWVSMDFTRPLQTIFINWYILLVNVYSNKRNFYNKSRNIYLSSISSILFTLITIYILAFLFSHTQVESIIYNNSVFKL